MNSIALTNLEQADANTPLLTPVDLDLPTPGPFELLIRVHAAGLTPTELQWYPTSHCKSGDARTGAVPGHEFSGTVAAIGENVGSLEIGREVFGMNDWFAQGAMAEFCVAPFASVAPKPREVRHVDAAAAPISGLTAWQGLFGRAQLQRGERVLIHGGAGAVGSFAVQLAGIHGATVFATASTANVAFVQSLGAHVVIDYETSSFEDVATDVDVVFDTVGGECLKRSWGLLKPGGRVVTIAAGSQTSADARVRDAFFITEPDQKQLVTIGNLMAERRIRAVVDEVIPLSEAPRAYAGQLPRQGRGKIVVAI